MYAGIDYSLTCPAITIGKKKAFKYCKSFFYINNKKYVGKFSNNIFGLKSLPYESQMERIDNISNWALSVVLHAKVKFVTIEGYSMGSHGRVFDIAENGGLLKYKLWLNKIEFQEIAPSALKKFYSGKGNANKELMVQTFKDNTKIEIDDIMKCKMGNSPVSDIVDSYAAYLYNFI